MHTVSQKPGRPRSLEASKPDRDDDGAKIGPDDRTNQDDIDPDRLNDPNDPGRTILDERLNRTNMKPAYIILTETAERFDLDKANEFNPNEYDLSYEFQDRKIGFYFTSLYPNESYCYTPDYEGEDEPITATTLGFRAYDSAGNLICEDEGGSGIWLQPNGFYDKNQPNDQDIIKLYYNFEASKIINQQNEPQCYNRGVRQ